MFTKEELTKFKDNMLDLCNKLDIEVDPRFEKRVMDSVCVENTLRNHMCDTLDELFKLFSNWILEHPDSSTCKYCIKCRTNSFFGDIYEV